MNLRKKSAAVCAAAMLLLTSCGYDKNTDISQWNPEYFKYCFGEDATCKRTTDENRDPEDKEDTDEYYTITYTDKTGETYTSTHWVTPYKDRRESEEAFSKEAYYNYQMEQIVWETAHDVIRHSFIEQVLKKHFDGIEDDHGTHIGDTASFTIIALPRVWSYGFEWDPGIEDSLGEKLGAAHLDPQTGWQACTADWTTFANDPQWEWTVVMRLSADADPDDYLPAFQAVYEEFRACADQPQSCNFVFKQSAPDDVNDMTTLWRTELFLGEEIDTREWYEQNQTDPSVEKTRRLRAYYGG